MNKNGCFDYYFLQCKVGTHRSTINTNFRLRFLLTRLQEALYEDLPVENIKFEVNHHFSGLSFLAEVSFGSPLTMSFLTFFSSESVVALSM